MDFKSQKNSPISDDIKSGSVETSVPYQYNVWYGVNFQHHRFVFTAGLRHEGVPAEDLIGERNGFRRTSYIISAQPDITFNINKPVASFVTIACNG